MKKLYILIFIGLISCNKVNQDRVLDTSSLSLVDSTPMINDFGKTVIERFDPPIGYDRITIPNQSFGEYLRTLALKPEGIPARYFNGKVKANDDIYVSVVDLPISPKDLQSSSDAVIRLKSEYLFSIKKYNQINFHSGKKMIKFTDFAEGDYSKQKFNQFLDYVMAEVSTPSFCEDLQAVKLKDLQIGDIFVQNTQPNGHAVIVVDLVKNSKGEKLFLLAQSFQPAQEIQIIANPERDDISPWYQVREGELLTPEWRFMSSDLMRFKDLQY